MYCGHAIGETSAAGVLLSGRLITVALFGCAKVASGTWGTMSASWRCGLGYVSGEASRDVIQVRPVDAAGAEVTQKEQAVAVTPLMALVESEVIEMISDLVNLENA